MPHFIPRKIRLRKTSPKSGHEVSLPPDWIKYHGLDKGNKETLELLYDSIIVLIPPGVKVNKKALADIIEESSDR